MKNTLTKIFLVTLTTVLLIGAMAGISVFATDAEADTYEIKSINVIHEANSIVLIAVDLPSDTELTTAPDVVVDYTLNGETQTAKYHSYQYIEKYGKWYPAYYTVGIAPVDISESVTAVAYKTGAAQDASKAKSTSLAEYLYTRLYRDDVISATEGDDLDRKGMYLALLEYGSYAQNVFWNNKAENAENQRTLANEYFYVCSGEATVDGGESVLLSESAAVTLAGAAVAPAEYVQTGWSVKKYDKDGTYLGTEQVSGTTYTVESNAVVVPTYARAWEDYEDGTSSNYGDGDNKCKVSYETEDGNTFYRAAKTETSADDYIYIPLNTTDYADGNCTVFETKLRINHEGTTEFIVELKLNSWNGTNILYFGNSNADDRTSIRVSNGSISATYPGIYTNEWFDVRVECYMDDSNNVTSSNVYINGVYIGTNTTVATLSSDLTRGVVKSNINVSGGVDLDNTYFGEGKANTFDDVVNDFENSAVASTGGKVSGSNATVTLKNASAGAASSIGETDGNKHLDIAIGGWMDLVTFKPTVPAAEGHTKFVFEADFKATKQVMFNLFGTDTSSPSTKIYFHNDTSDGTWGFNYGSDWKKPANAVRGEWAHVRIECNATTLYVYLNGTLIYEAASASYTGISAVYMYTFSGGAGDTISIDNVKAGFIAE